MAIYNDATTLRSILEKNNATTVQFGPLQQIFFPETRSELIKENGSMLWAFTGSGLEGLFRKDKEDTFAYGKKRCAMVKEEFSCGGFFTTDELPRYGISRQNIREIFQQMNKEKGDGTLIFLLSYDKQMSTTIREFVITQLSSEITQVFGSTPSTTVQIAA